MPRRRPFSGLFTRNYQRAPVTITIREPLPLNRARPSVAQLPGQVVQRILNFLQYSHPEDVLKVAALSSSLYELARYIQHQVVHVDISKSGHIDDRLDLIIRNGLLPAIRTLEISGKGFDESQEWGKEILNRFASMISGMTGLRDIDWQVTGVILQWNRNDTTSIPIPLPILESLACDVRLHSSIICNPAQGSHPQARNFLDRLVNNQHLQSLSVQVSFIHEQECLETMRVLKKVLLSCPNLTRLPLLDVWYPRGGCEGFGPPVQGPYCGLGLSDGEKPQALEELGMHDYPWGIGNAPRCQGYSEQGFEWDYWARTFDWSHLKRLNDMNPYMAFFIAPKMTGLRELVLEDYGWEPANFIGEITSPLEFLSLPSWYSVSDKAELINRFGSTLRELKIHRPEVLWRSSTHSFVSAANLRQLRDGLPYLKNLSLDITRDDIVGQWPYKALDVIATFTSLRVVELWFPLGKSPPAPKPILTVSSARHLFRYLRERNGNIQRVILHSGSPLPSVAPCWAGGGSYEPSWAMYNSVDLVCSMVYDNDTDEGSFGVACQNLSVDINAQLQSLEGREDRDLTDPQELDAEGLRLRVALDGPLNKNEWEAWRSEQTKSRREQKSAMLGRFILRSR